MEGGEQKIHKSYGNQRKTHKAQADLFPCVRICIDKIYYLTPLHMRKNIVQKTFGSYRAPSVSFPDLVGHQRASFDWLVKDGLKELFKEFSPINDYSGKKFELRFEDFGVGEPKFDERFARENARTYEAPVKRSEEHTSELQSQFHLVCRLLLEK